MHVNINTVVLKCLAQGPHVTLVPTMSLLCACVGKRGGRVPTQNMRIGNSGSFTNLCTCNVSPLNYGSEIKT